MNNIKVYAFVGPSGTGKSYRAQMVANENNIHYIIDDGLFINDSFVLFCFHLSFTSDLLLLQIRLSLSHAQGLYALALN